MDRLETTTEHSTVSYKTQIERPAISMTSLRQTLVELRKQARLHDREALTACLTLAISLAKTKPAS